MPDGEFELIEKQLRPLASNFPGALNLLDDAALVDCDPSSQLVIAKDAIVENVHFRNVDPPASIARKLLRCNLSDLAAMGASPLAYLTALMLPSTVEDAWLSAFAKSLHEDQRNFGLHLIGGDITSTPGPLSLSCTIIGKVPSNQAVHRSGARIGDKIWVSGSLGDAALGLRIAQGLAADEETAMILIDRYLHPRPRVEVGTRLRDFANAMIDVSDGLVADLSHIAAASNAGARIWPDLLPLSETAASVPGSREAALYGGDDYELLFTSPPQTKPEIERISDQCGVALTLIGEITEGNRVRLCGADGKDYQPEHSGWRHR